MSNIELLVNGNITVIYEEKGYKSVIQDVDEDYFLISIPVGEGTYLTLNKGDKLEINYYIDGGNYYSFNCEILERVIENKMPFYKVSSPYNIEKIQRRDFVRVNLVEYAFYKKEGSNTENLWNRGILLDLSGGGLRIKVKEKVSLNDKIIISLFIDEKKIHVIGTVVRIETNPEREYICGLEFMDLDERKRDKIIEKVFMQMRKQRELI